MLSLILDHPFVAFLVWTLLAAGAGVIFGKAIAHADAVEQPEPLSTDTAELRWADRPATWL